MTYATTVIWQQSNFHQQNYVCCVVQVKVKGVSEDRVVYVLCVLMLEVCYPAPATTNSSCPVLSQSRCSESCALSSLHAMHLSLPRC